MKRRPCSLAPALTALAVLGLTRPGSAGQPSPDLVPFNATLTSRIAYGLFIPLDPPIVSQDSTGTGQADFLGPVTLVDHNLAILSLAGGPAIAITDGIEVITAAHGDAIFIHYSGLSRPPAAGEFTAGELAFTVTGGQGQFAGATGSGVGHASVKGSPPNLSVTTTYVGMISRPKP
jgi:hypothetical protein